MTMKKKLSWAFLLSLVAFKSMSHAGYFADGDFIEGYSTVASAGASTVLVKGSARNLKITGATTQDVVLPDATTVKVGKPYIIHNASTGTVTVKDNGLNTIASLLSGEYAKILSTSAASSNGSWVVQKPVPAISASSGSVLFSDGTSIQQDNSNFYWDNTNNRLGVGVAASENTVTLGGASLGSTFTVHAEGGTDLAEVSTHRHSDTAGFGAHSLLVRSRGTEASETVVQNNDTLGRIAALGNDGTDYEVGTQIDFDVDGTPGAGDMPGRIVFKVSPDGSATPAEAMRISQNKTVSFQGAIDTALSIAGPVVTDSSGGLSSVSVGTAGQILTSNGAGSNPSFQDPAAAPSASYEISNVGIAASVGASALTIALKQSDGSSDCSAGGPCKIGFRNGTSTVGGYNQRSVTASLSLTISSGSTLGHVSSATEYIYVYAIDNSGTVELAASTSVYADDGTPVSTVAEGGAGGADSRNSIYSTTLRSGVPIRLIGRIKISEGTAGTWATAPTEVSLRPFRGGPRSSVSWIGSDGRGGTNTKIRRPTTVTTTGTALTSATDATNGGSITVNEAGVYSMSYTEYHSTTACGFGISRNSNQLTTTITSITDAHALMISNTPSGLRGHASVTVPLNVGDVIRAHDDGTCEGASASTFRFMMTKVSD